MMGSSGKKRKGSSPSPQKFPKFSEPFSPGQRYNFQTENMTSASHPNLASSRGPSPLLIATWP